MGQNKFEWPLINDNITEQDKEALIKWLQEPDVRFTQSKYVKEFEQAWSDWLGVKYTVFVNSRRLPEAEKLSFHPLVGSLTFRQLLILV